MFERMSERARQIVVLAHDDARALRARELEPWHLLLGGAVEPGALPSLLAERGVAVADLRQAVVDTTDHPGRSGRGQLPYSTASRAAFERADRLRAEAYNDRVTQDHLVLAVVETSEPCRALLLRGGAGDLRAALADAVAARRGERIDDFDGLG